MNFGNPIPDLAESSQTDSELHTTIYIPYGYRETWQCNIFVIDLSYGIIKDCLDWYLSREHAEPMVLDFYYPYGTLPWLYTDFFDQAWSFKNLEQCHVEHGEDNKIEVCTVALLLSLSWCKRAGALNTHATFCVLPRPLIHHHAVEKHQLRKNLV